MSGLQDVYIINAKDVEVFNEKKEPRLLLVSRDGILFDKSINRKITREIRRQRHLLKSKS